MLKQQLSSFFSAKVQLTCSEKGKGKISIPFSNEEELERIIGILDTLKINDEEEKNISNRYRPAALLYADGRDCYVWSEPPARRFQRIHRLQADSLHTLRKAVQMQADSLTPATDKPMPHQAVTPADSITTADSIAAENKKNCWK